MMVVSTASFMYGPCIIGSRFSWWWWWWWYEMKRIMMTGMMVRLMLIVTITNAATVVVANATTETLFNVTNMKKIVGGIPVRPDDTQYRPAFAFVEWIGCGGTLIHDDIVLTAGHCFAGRNNVLGRNVYLGSTKRDGSDAIQTLQIANVRIHPMYTTYAFSSDLTHSVNISYTVENAEYDYALLQLSSTATNITPIPYNTDSGTPIDNSELITMGYGLTTQDGSLSLDLRQVNVNAININTCAMAYQNEFDTVSALCAAAPNKDACNGDSGGPLLQVVPSPMSTSTNTTSVVVVVGIVSGGIGCAQPTFPGIYSRVSLVANDFIRNGICEMSHVVTAPSLQCPTPAPTPSRQCQQCYKNEWLGLRFGLGTQMYFPGRRRRHNIGDDVCREACQFNWSLWYWKLIGWKCGECPI